jgi:methyltransferase-like protein/2-polyprenyl-3-methyl-5-hydroxy-6-metoxy-1,4-benzoquinol methylase
MQGAFPLSTSGYVSNGQTDFNEKREKGKPVEINSATPETSYDAIPYESNPFSESHPDRLATIGRIFGMRPAEVTHCRVLEMGCSSGGNLIPAACLLPESEFVGMDLSLRQVEMGRQMINDLGLTNIRIQHADIRDVDASWGTYDYIISHGVFSWVPAEIRDKMLAVAQANLAPRGIAYVSYNTYPGWHMREAIRHMMLFHSRQFPDNMQKLRQARALIAFLAGNVPTENNAFGLLLKSELEVIKNSEDYYLFHDHLEEVNVPVYFHQFAEQAGRHGLQYLGEADFSTMLTSGFSKDVAETLNRISPNIVNTEQYMDFARNRYFRQTLLCRKNIVLNRNIKPAVVEDLLVASNAAPEETPPDFSPETGLTFRTPEGASIKASLPITKAALTVLSENWPRALTLSALTREAERRLNDPGADHQANRRSIATDLLHCYTRRVVAFHTWQGDFVARAGEKPKAAPLALYMCRQGRTRVFNQCHDVIDLDVMAQHILPTLDGTRDRTALLAQVEDLIRKGVLTAHQDGKLVADPALIRGTLEHLVDQSLTQLARNALLIS